MDSNKLNDVGDKLIKTGSAITGCVFMAFIAAGLFACFFSLVLGG